MKMIRTILCVFVLFIVNEAAWADLVAHWGFDETSGAVVYDSGPNGYHGMLIGSAAVTAEIGRGGVLQLGGEGYMETADFSVGDTFTVCLWINPADTNTNQNFIGKHTSTGGNIFLFGFYNSGYHVRIGSQTNTGGTFQAGWQHLAAVVEKLNGTQSQVTVYRNGVQLWSQVLDSVMTNPEGKAWVVGMDWDSGPTATDFFDGQMDTIRIYNSALTEQEVVNVYNTDYYELTVGVEPTVIGASVELDPVGGSYPPDSEVTLTATIPEGYMFDHWSGDLDSSDNPANITMDTDKNITANYIKLYTLDVQTNITAGRVIVDPDKSYYYPGEELTLTTIADDDFAFSYWSGDLTGSDNPETIIMDTDKTVIANFIYLYDTLYVDDGGTMPFSQIQIAIDIAKEGDTIIVMPGIYYENLNMKGKSITLRSTDPTDPNIVDHTIINGQKAGSVITCSSREDSNTVISGFLIKDGSASYGGGLYNKSSSPTVSNCIIENNWSENEGGGMYNYKSHPTVTNCTFYWNFTKYSGGGVYNVSSSPKITGCTFFNNFTYNRDGGGMFNLNSSPTITGCIFFANSASNMGGGMYNWSLGGELISKPTLINCTFSRNSTGYSSDGICNDNSSLTVRNCILWNGGDEIQNHNESITIVSYSNIEDGWPDGQGNIDVDPYFVDNNLGDLYLKSQGGRWDPVNKYWNKDTTTSPCIDAGDPNTDWTGELWPHGKRVNMGAYGGSAEASMSLSEVGNTCDFTGDGSVDLLDWYIFSQQWLWDKVLLQSDLDRDGTVQPDDLERFTTEWLWRE